MKQISILVSTVDNGLKNNPNFFSNIDFDICEVIVVQQLINSSEKLVLENGAKVYSFNEKGVSKARNRAIELASCSIALLADDDTYFIEGFDKAIIKAYAKYQNADIITFQAKNTLDKPFKKYINKEYKHNFRTILKISAIEITLNLAKLGKRKLFDENFGPGSICSCGSDTVFVVDSLKAGLNMYNVPLPIVVHPPLSSGRTYSIEKTYHKGIMYRRSFGFASFILALFFAILKYQEYKKDLGFFCFISQFWKGCLVKLRVV